MSIADGNLLTARAAYEIAEKAYWVERDRGGIVEIDRSVPSEEESWRAGQRWKCVTPEGRMAMGMWQKAKAELDAANAAVMRERGLETPSEPAPRYAPDSRLPAERDEGEAWA